MMDTSTDKLVNLQTKEQFKAEIARWAADMKTNPTQIRVQRMTKKWASCSNKGWVSFSADLLQEPETFQKYDIVHELLHLQVPNHGKLFKSLMNAYLPGWQAILAERIGDGAIYLYDYQSAGRSNIENMKELAIAGKGLNSFISRVVRKGYVSKLR